ncbi:unnamed protein product [Urochloa decumbens]|uniref:Uncharacterized protein n=1 Tax=Urochloa decumbens TaxID=240449 RepID=A0ABC9EQH2_9POAL
MATEDEAREAADGTEVQVEAVGLGTVHSEAHPEVKLPSIMEIKNVGENIDSAEGTLKFPEDQVLVEAPSEVELPPEHNVNGKASSLNGHMDKEEKISNEQLHENNQEEAELDGTIAHQSNGISKEEVTDILSHGESTTEDNSLLKHEKDEEPSGDDQQDLDVTVDVDSVREDTLKIDSAIEQTDDGQQDQNQEPEKANEGTQPASTAHANVEIVAEAPTVLQTPVEPNLDDSGSVTGNINEKTETDHKEGFPEETSTAEPTEEAVKVEDQQSQQAYMMDADVVQEEMLKREETHVQEEVPNYEAHEPTTNAQETPNKESAEEIDDPRNENDEETMNQSNMEAPKETTPELDNATRAPPVNVQVQNHEPSEEIEHAEAVDTEAEKQQSSVAFEDAILEDQHNLSVTMGNDPVQEDTLKAIEQKDDGQQDQDQEPEKTTEATQPASMANIPDVEVVAEAPSGVQTPVEPNLENQVIPNTIDGNTETDEPAKAEGVVHPDHKESFPEDASIAEPAKEMVKVEDQESQQADAVDADVVQEDVPKSEHADEPATHEVLNQESTEETDGPVNENTEESAHQSNMAAPEETTTENDTITVGLPVNIQVPVEEIEDSEAVDAEAAMQQSTAAFEEAIPEDQHNLGITMDGDIVQENTLEAIEETEDVPRNHALEKEKTTKNTLSAIMASIPDVEVVDEAPSGVQTPVEINLDNSDAIPDTADGNTEIDESAKAEDATATSEPQMIETEEEQKDIETTEAQEITVHGHVTPSKELSAEDDSTADETHNDDIQQTLGQDLVEVKETVFTSEDNVEDNVTAEEQTCDSQEVDNAESTEETKGNTAENIAEISDVLIVDAVEEQNVLETEDIAETHMRELEPEETKNTEPIESEEASDQRNVVLFDDLAQEDTPESEMQQTESATEATETEAATQESNDCVSEEPSSEDHKIESETECDTQEVIDGAKDTITAGSSGQSNMISAGVSAQENNAFESDPTADIQPVQKLEPEPEEINNTKLAAVKETSHEMNTTIFQTPIEEDNRATIDLHESAREMSNIETTEVGTPHQSDAAQSEEQTLEGIASEPQVPLEEMNDTEATEPPNMSQGNLISTSGESVPEEIATEDKTSTEPDGDHQRLQDHESTDLMETEADKIEGIASSSTLSTFEQSTSEDNETTTEPSADTQAENSEPAEVTEAAENVKSNTALAEAAAPEEHVETEATADTSSVKEPELEETKDDEPAGTEDIMTSSVLPAKNMDMQTMGTEAVAGESHVESIKEITEDDTEPVLELESVEGTKFTDTIEHPGEPHSSTSDEPTLIEENTTVTESDTQQVPNVISQEIKDSENTKTEEFSDLGIIDTPEEADQGSNLPRTEPTTYVQQEQELGSTEETTDIVSMGAEDHHQQGVSALEEPAVDSEPNVDDQQVHEEKVPEVKGNEAMEAEEVVQQNNIDNPHDATEEKSELRSDPDSYAQPAQHVELSRDSENNQLVKADEPSGQVNAIAIEKTPTEDSFASEIDPSVGNEAEEEFHTSQVDATEKPASEGNVAPIEPTSEIKQDNELEATKEISGIEVINDGAQTENATSEGPSPMDNETTPERHLAELNEETMGTETDDVMPVPGIKDDIQTSVELKDGACDLDETVLTTEGSENVIDEAAVQSPGDDILETSNNINQVKEEQKDGCEHNSSEISGVQNVGNIIHVQDRDISGEPLIKSGTEEASQVLFESDPQGAQDAAKEDEQTSDLSKQPDDVELQLQTCEADALSNGRQDEVVKNVDLDQQQKEDGKIESQKEELQADEQKHEDKGDDFTMEPLVDPKDIENSTKNRTEDTAKAEQTEVAISENLKHEVPHVSEESTPSSMDMTVDNVKGTHEVTEEDADDKNDNKDEESAKKNDIVATYSTNEQDETTDEIKNEELEPSLASSGQEASEPSPSNDDILENDPAAVTQNVESGEHSEDKECTDKVNDDVRTIQASEAEITGEINENREIQNEDNAINHDESQTKPEEEEASQLHSDEPGNMDAKIDDAITLGREIIDGNASIKPRENENIVENKGLDSTSELFVEPSIQNNVEQDLSSHQKVEDEKLSMAEQNDVDFEPASDIQEKADESASDINLTSQCQEETNTYDVQQLEIEENSSDNIDEPVSHEKTDTSTTEAVTINDSITNKASEADGGSSDGSLKTCNDTGRDLDVSSVITASKEESVNENMEDHKLALHAQDENTPEQALYLEKTDREMPSSQKILPTEPEENQIPNESNEEELQDENPIPNEKNEEDMKDAEIGDAQKDVEQDLPVSNFLMNLILGKKNGDADENPESKAERKHGETTEDNSCVLISKQEESVGSLSTGNKVDDDLTFEQEKHDARCSEETQEMVKEQSDDLKLENERSIHTDEESNKNTRDLETLAQGNPEDKISGEVSSEEAARVSTKMETRDIEISNLELDDKEVNTVCQEKTEASTKIENGSLNSNINDLTNTEASEEDSLGEGETGISHESLPEDKSADAVSKETPLLTESDMVDEKDLSCDAEAVQDLACAKEDATTEPSIKATTTTDIQLEREEVEKKEEEQHASMDTNEVSGEDAEISNDNVQKSTSSEETSDEQAPQITEPVSDTQKIFVHEKEISEGSTCMDEKESSNFSTKGVENFQTAVEIQADGPNIKVNQDMKDEVADNKTTMEPEKLGKSDFEEHQETATEQKSPKATDEGETMIKEQVVPRTVESHEQTVSIKSNEEQELLDSKVQESDLVVSPREASAAEENFVDVTKPEFSTDEEQSPKADAEEKTYDEKIKDFTDGAATKTEVPGATQKARKKLNLLSGVGSKVKQQLAKVKKAIIRKPGNTKPDSPKS